MYDCKKGHWFCGDEFDFDRCKNIRQLAKIHKSAGLGRAPLKKYANVSDCTLKQIELITKAMPKNFCWQDKNRF